MHIRANRAVTFGNKHGHVCVEVVGLSVRLRINNQEVRRVPLRRFRNSFDKTYDLAFRWDKLIGPALGVKDITGEDLIDVNNFIVGLILAEVKENKELLDATQRDQA
jgi:hypothetical protein